MEKEVKAELQKTQDSTDVKQDPLRGWSSDLGKRIELSNRGAWVSMEYDYLEAHNNDGAPNGRREYNISYTDVVRQQVSFALKVDEAGTFSIEPEAEGYKGYDADTYAFPIKVAASGRNSFDISVLDSQKYGPFEKEEGIDRERIFKVVPNGIAINDEILVPFKPNGYFGEPRAFVPKTLRRP